MPASHQCSWGYKERLEPAWGDRWHIDDQQNYPECDRHESGIGLSTSPYGLHRLYLRLIPGISGKARVRLFSSRNVTSKVRSWVMIVVAQAALSST